MFALRSNNCLGERKRCPFPGAFFLAILINSTRQHKYKRRALTQPQALEKPDFHVMPCDNMYYSTPAAFYYGKGDACISVRPDLVAGKY
jgi:hypothetical protein